MQFSTLFSYQLLCIIINNKLGSKGVNAFTSTTLPFQTLHGTSLLNKQTTLSIKALENVPFHKIQRGFISTILSASDDDFFDGYDDFIASLEQDSGKDSFERYRDDNNPVRQDRGRQQRPDSRRSVQYKRDPTDDPSVSVDINLVSNLLEKRSQAKSERNFNLADDIRDQLQNDLGVYVWDKEGVWSTSPLSPSKKYDGKNKSMMRSDRRGSNQDRRGSNNRDRFGRDRRGPKTREFGRHGHDYVQIGDGIDTEKCPLSLDEIHKLLAQRLEYKLNRDFRMADEIQGVLLQNGVWVHDKMKHWRADGGVFSDIDTGRTSNSANGPIEYTISTYSEPMDDEEKIAEIQNMVVLRASFRSQSNYKEADDVRDKLWNDYNVAVDDRTKSWSVGGSFGPNGTFKWTERGPVDPRRGVDPALAKDWREVGMYTQSPHSRGLDNPENEEEVNNLVHDRLEAKRVRDYKVADYIRDHLYKEYDVTVDDKLRQWSVGGEFGAIASSFSMNSPTAPDGKRLGPYHRTYNLRGGTGHLSDKDVALVEAMIKRRSEEMARYNREAAESIRNGLKAKFYVILDDINGEWHVRGNEYVLSPSFKSKVPTFIEESLSEIEALIRERVQAKMERDFDRADEIRADLLDTYGITIDDRLKEWRIKETNFYTNDEEEGDDGEEEEDDDDNDNVAISSEWDDQVESNEIVNENIDIDDEEQNEDEDVDTDEESMDEEFLSKLTVVQLKDKLKALGLPVSGKKADLITRLLSN
jgi:cysteinyl-tRNA synthetase